MAIDIAASLLGLVVNPAIPIYRDREMAFILADASTRVLFIPDRSRNFDCPDMLGYSQLVNGVGPDELKLLLYTSGTTGRTKEMMHSHNTLTRAIDNGCEAWQLTRDDIMLMPSPVMHITGLANWIELPFLTGSRSAFMGQ